MEVNPASINKSVINDSNVLSRQSNQLKSHHAHQKQQMQGVCSYVEQAH